ncbi:hypothetical protein EDM56_30385 [Brevibacillus fluminis]|uniref:Uncharacterized protein n=1 Tax=Brevibacillus fluminis TaxID=511487 RepID=A0A3M8CSK7_9BACL|nr:hypothetical protein EDM56_30385 [Brevibacillus fluminis]
MVGDYFIRTNGTYTFLSKMAPKKWFILRGNWVPQITDFIHLFVKFGILHRAKIAYFEEKERTHEKPLIARVFTCLLLSHFP